MLASHQCGLGSNPDLDAMCRLSLLLVLSLAPRGFSLGTLVFPSPQKPTRSLTTVACSRGSDQVDSKRDVSKTQKKNREGVGWGWERSECLEQANLERTDTLNEFIRNPKHFVGKQITNYIFLQWRTSRLHQTASTNLYQCMWSSSFPITCRLLFIVSTQILVVSHNCLSIKIVLSCFYLLIFNFFFHV